MLSLIAAVKQGKVPGLVYIKLHVCAPMAAIGVTYRSRRRRRCRRWAGRGP